MHEMPRSSGSKFGEYVCTMYHTNSHAHKNLFLPLFSLNFPPIPPYPPLLRPHDVIFYSSCSLHRPPPPLAGLSHGVPRRIRLDDGIATAIGEHESKQSDEQNTTPNFSLHQETSELSIYMLSMITLAEMSMSDTEDKTFYPTIATEYPTMYPTIRDEELGSSTGHEEGEGWWWSDGI